MAKQNKKIKNVEQTAPVERPSPEEDEFLLMVKKYKQGDYRHEIYYDDLHQCYMARRRIKDYFDDLCSLHVTSEEAMLHAGAIKVLRKRKGESLADEKKKEFEKIKETFLSDKRIINAIEGWKRKEQELRMLESYLNRKSSAESLILVFYMMVIVPAVVIPLLLRI